MKMDGMTIRHASAMPAPTWSWLKMNDVTVKIPDGLERTCQVEIEAGDTLDNTTSFESAIARLQERLDAERSDARADSRAICVAATRKDKAPRTSMSPPFPPTRSAPPSPRWPVMSPPTLRPASASTPAPI